MTISYSEFKELPAKQQKETLEALRKEIGISALIQSWGISRSKVYNIIHDLGLSVSPKTKKSISNKNNDTPGKAKKKKQIMSSQNGGKESKAARLNSENITIGQLPFSVSLTAQGPFQTVSEKMQLMFQHNLVPEANVRITLNIEQI